MTGDPARTGQRGDLTKVVYVRAPIELVEQLHREAGVRMTSVNQVAIDLIRAGLMAEDARQ